MSESAPDPGQIPGRGYVLTLRIDPFVLPLGKF